MFRTIELMRKRSNLTKELNDRDLKNFNNITEYIGLSSLSPLEQEVVFQQILDMMLQAKSEGKFASEVIGDDIKGFCDSIIEESNYNKNIFQICFNYIEIILQTGLIYLLMMFIFSLIRNGWDSSLKNQEVFYIDIVSLLSMFIVIFSLNFFIRRKQIFKRKKGKTGYSWVFLFVCMFLSLRITDMITVKFPQLATTHIIPNDNKMFLLIIFFIAFGRYIFYHIKNIRCHSRGKWQK
jgi:DNA-binding ferritin-like protein (Dps family)